MDCLKDQHWVTYFSILRRYGTKAFFVVWNYPCIKFSMEGCLSEAEPYWVHSFIPHSYRVKFLQFIMKSREILGLLFGGNWQVHISNSLLKLLSDAFLTLNWLTPVSLYNYFRPSLVYPKYISPLLLSFHWWLYCLSWRPISSDRYFFPNFLPFKMFWILTNYFLF